MLNRPLERGRRSERGIDRFPVSVNHRWESVPTVDNKTGKTNALRVESQGVGGRDEKVKELISCRHDATS